MTYASATGLGQDPQPVHSTERPPDDVVWPGYVQYEQGLIGALGAASGIVDRSYEEGGQLSAPIMNQVNGLITTVEATTGMKLSQLQSIAGDIGRLSQATRPDQVVTAVAQLLDTSLEIVVGVAEAAGAASSALQGIPIIGAFIQGVASLLVGSLRAEVRVSAAEIECQRAVEDAMTVHCQALARAAIPAPTAKVLSGEVSPARIDPSDLFRPVFYAWQAHRGKRKGEARLPLTPASLYVAMCGGETQGFGPFTRDSWKQTVEHYRKASGKPYIGIPPATQRHMWSVIKGIMAQAQDPGFVKMPETQGDSGRSLYPIVQDILRGLYLSAKFPEEHWRGVGIDFGFVQTVQNVVLNQYDLYQECRIGEVGRIPTGAASCAYQPGPRINLAAAFEKGLLQYQQALSAEFFRGGRWHVTPRSSPDPGPIRGVLTIPRGSAAMRTLLQGDANVRAAISGPRRYTGLQKAFMLLGAAGAGYGSFSLVRARGWGKR